MPLTVTKLARACKLSRSALLYYESIGLLPRPRRTGGNYRTYSEKDVERLRQICVYRDAGAPLKDIRSILDGPRNGAAAAPVGTERRYRKTARTAAHDCEIARKHKTTEETPHGYEREMGCRHEGRRFQRRPNASLARRVRKDRAGGAPGIPGVPTHSGSGAEPDSGVEPEAELVDG